MNIVEITKAAFIQHRDQQYEDEDMSLCVEEILYEMERGVQLHYENYVITFEKQELPVVDAYVLRVDSQLSTLGHVMIDVEHDSYDGAEIFYDDMYEVEARQVMVTRYFKK